MFYAFVQSVNVDISLFQNAQSKNSRKKNRKNRNRQQNALESKKNDVKESNAATGEDDTSKQGLILRTFLFILEAVILRKFIVCLSSFLRATLEEIDVLGIVPIIY